MIVAKTLFSVKASIAFASAYRGPGAFQLIGMRFAISSTCKNVHTVLERVMDRAMDDSVIPSSKGLGERYLGPALAHCQRSAAERTAPNDER